MKDFLTEIDHIMESDLAEDALQANPDDLELVIKDLDIEHETEFGGVYLKISSEVLQALGFAFGDSVDIAFSNGYTVQGLPYYNGYYTQIGEPLLVGYPGYPYVDFCINGGDDTFVLAGLTEQDQATITLAERGRYLSIQNARSIRYQDDRDAYGSDVIFANFRNVAVGGIREGRLYRSASPCNNEHNRASYVDTLMGRLGCRRSSIWRTTRKRSRTICRRAIFNPQTS